MASLQWLLERPIARRELVLEPSVSQEATSTRLQTRDSQPSHFALPHYPQDVGFTDENEFLTVQFDIGCS